MSTGPVAKETGETGCHGNGQQRRDETQKAAKREPRGLSSSPGPPDKRSGCTREEESILLREEVHLFCGSSASVSSYTLNVKPH